jgi:hypothetical protein
VRYDGGFHPPRQSPQSRRSGLIPFRAAVLLLALVLRCGGRDSERMIKSERMEAAIANEPEDNGGWHPCYAGFFRRFNAGQYYEAHDILEHLWLRSAGPEHKYYKGLIQLAGAFVHMRKQYERPTHPKDGRRLRPAVRLLALAKQNTVPFWSVKTGLQLGIIDLCVNSYTHAIVSGNYLVNPWRPDGRPSFYISAFDATV